MTPERCQCDSPGFCQLLRRECDPLEGRKMSAVRHEECRDKPAYFEMFLAETSKPCAPVGKPRGLGDTVAQGLAWLGVKPKGGCGCSKRQAWLNRLFPYRE